MGRHGATRWPEIYHQALKPVEGLSHLEEGVGMAAKCAKRLIRASAALAACGAVSCSLKAASVGSMAGKFGVLYSPAKARRRVAAPARQHGGGHLHIAGKWRAPAWPKMLYIMAGGGVAFVTHRLARPRVWRGSSPTMHHQSCRLVIAPAA